MTACTNTFSIRLSSGFNWDKGRKLAPSAEQKEGKADMPPPAEEEELPPGSKSELVGGSSPVDQPQSHKQCASADDLKMEKPARHYDAQIAQAKAGEAASHWGDRIMVRARHQCQPPTSSMTCNSLGLSRNLLGTSQMAPVLTMRHRRR